MTHIPVYVDVNNFVLNLFLVVNTLGTILEAVLDIKELHILFREHEDYNKDNIYLKKKVNIVNDIKSNIMQSIMDDINNVIKEDVKDKI